MRVSNRADDKALEISIAEKQFRVDRYL